MGIMTEAGFHDGKFLKAGQFHKAEGETVETGVGGHAVDLDGMTKDELLAEASKRGVTVKATGTKAEIIAAINGAG